MSLVQSRKLGELGEELQKCKINVIAKMQNFVESFLFAASIIKIFSCF